MLGVLSVLRGFQIQQLGADLTLSQSTGSAALTRVQATTQCTAHSAAHAAASAAAATLYCCTRCCQCAAATHSVLLLHTVCCCYTQCAAAVRCVSDGWVAGDSYDAAALRQCAEHCIR